MKTAILCVAFLIIGAAAGSALTGYFVDKFHKRAYATFFAGELGLTAMHAEMIKQGDVDIVLGTLERAIPTYVIAVSENSEMRDSMVGESAMMATKRFYVCTKTSIPSQIAVHLEGVSLPENTCEAQR
jgi:hypothetical protein